MNYSTIITLQALLLVSQSVVAADAPTSTTSLLAPQRTGARCCECVVGSCLCTLGVIVCLAIPGSLIACTVIGESWGARLPSNNTEATNPLPVHPSAGTSSLLYGFQVRGLYNSVCPTLVVKRDTCTFKSAEWPALKQEILTVCNNATVVEPLSAISTSPAPVPPCKEIKVALQELATTCSSQRFNVSSTTPVVSSNTTRVKYYTLLKKLADKRKPALLRH